MEKNYSAKIATKFGPKEIAVYFGDIMDFEEPIDILTTSAFVNSYEPVSRTVFGALFHHGISVKALAKSPVLDLRKFCHVWLSEEIHHPTSQIHRIGCVEMYGAHLNYYDPFAVEISLINSIRSYFSMLDIASIYNIKMDTIALPLLGSGVQNISIHLLLIPLINECISFLKRNNSVQRICFIERSAFKANAISEALQQSYNLQTQQEEAIDRNPQEQRRAMAFLSYSSADKNIADNLCSKLENRGVKVWYAPRDVKGPYAQAITEAIEKSTHFIVILSENSLKSQHVLNEIDLAFQGLPDKIKFKPLRIDEAIFTPSFKYYLSRQHWLDAVDPPLEERLNEFVEDLLSDL